MAPLPRPVTTPPVPTQEQMLDRTSLLATRAWIAWFTTLGRQFGFFQDVQSNGETLPQELGLNFLSPLTAVDNPANETIDVGFAGFETTTDANGTAVRIGTILIEFGQSAAIGTGGASVTVGITFPVPFAAPPVVTCNPDNRADNTGNFPFECIPTNITATGFTANFTCAVLIGGGGAAGIHNIVHCIWNAMGA